MKRTYWLLVLIPLGYGCDASRPTAPDQSMSPSAAASPAPRQWAQEVVIDYVSPHQHAGPGPHPQVESGRYALFSGGIRWFNNVDAVEYRITGTVSAAWNTAVVAGEDVWDAMISQRAFTRHDGTTQLNPCTGQPNTIAWTTIDGTGGILGYTSPCYNVLTKEIVGFTITMDVDEAWGTSGASTEMDVGNVATHEFGHAVGLAHVNSPRDACLTMFKYAIEGETQKRSPGLGDKLGMAFLYGNTDTSAGICYGL